MSCSCKGVFFSEIKDNIFCLMKIMILVETLRFFVMTAMHTFYFCNFLLFSLEAHYCNAEGYYRLVLSLLYLSNVRCQP